MNSNDTDASRFIRQSRIEARRIEARESAPPSRDRPLPIATLGGGQTGTQRLAIYKRRGGRALTFISQVFVPAYSKWVHATNSTVSLMREDLLVLSALVEAALERSDKEASR